MKLLILSVLASTLLFFSCRKSIDDERYPMVALNHCANTKINGNNVRICFDSLVSDSRCPLLVDCIWAGAAVVKLRLSANGQEAGFRLSIPEHPLSGNSDTTVLGYNVKLTEVWPYPGQGSGTPYVTVEIRQ